MLESETRASLAKAVGSKKQRTRKGALEQKNLTPFATTTKEIL